MSAPRMSQDDDAQVVHPQWQAWVAQNLARGATVDELCEALRDEGVPADEGRALVEQIDRSPAMQEARALWRRVTALEQMVRLRHDHRTAPIAQHSRIERRTLPPIEEFVARYLMPGVPVVVTDLITRWPALSRWTPDALSERLGDVSIEACVGREDVVDPDPVWEPLRQTMTVRALMERITGTGDAPSNDTYVIAKNAALRRPELQTLLDDLVLPPEYFGDTMDPTRMGLWIGPAGTHTPLHHDTDDSMFCQIYGRKRFRLAPPESLDLLDRSRGLYSHWNPRTEQELAEGPPLLELCLNAGELLFIPAGWWHQVDALDPSISLSILELAWPNDYGWYHPGSLLRGSKRA